MPLNSGTENDFGNVILTSTVEIALPERMFLLSISNLGVGEGSKEHLVARG